MTRPHFDTVLRPVLALVCLFLAATARAQDVQLQVSGDGVSVVKVDKIVVVREDATLVTSFPFQVKAPSDAGLYFWTVPPGVTAVDRGSVLEVTMAPKGQLVLTCKAVSAKLDKDGRFIGFDTKLGTVTVNVGEVTPPVPPVPPGPDPKPPGPVTGLRVLFVNGPTPLTREQLHIWNSTAIAAYLNAKTAKDNGQPGWRKWSRDIVLTDKTPALWKQLWADVQPKLATLPALVIVTDQSGQVFPLPPTEEETLKLLKQYGGE